MRSFFARHEVDRKAEGFNSGEKGFPSPGRVAWDSWGGDPGRSWVNRIGDGEKTKTATLVSKSDTSTIQRSEMAERIAHSYASIEKADKNPDGTLTVYGKATDDSIDIDQQICDEAWLKRAMPDWMMSGGNVREQHSNIAAGVATDYELKSDGHYITALVVDPVSVKKVETGVLKGFSIGIRSPRIIRDEKAAGGRIIDGTIVEVSLVDRPANPNAKLMLAKAAEDGELMAVEQVDAPVEESLESSEEQVVPEVVDPGEEVVESSEPAVTEETPVGDPEVEKAAELLNVAKSFSASLKKFDQATFDRARTELANLIQVEAKELAEGEDETYSLTQLLEAVHHLFEWYEGEVANGEVENPVVTDVEEESEEESATMAMKDVSEEMKCKECGSDLDDKAMEGKCYKCYKSAESDEETDAEKSVTIDFNEEQLTSIVEKAVAQAKASVTEEITLLKSALEAEQLEKSRLAGELVLAQKAVAPSGPKRSGGVTSNYNQIALLQKAAEYSLKADQTSDPVLRKGYKELAEEARLQANSKGE